MIDLRKTAEMALARLEHTIAYSNEEMQKIDEAKHALRQALAQPEQEPVAHLWECIGRWTAMIAHDGKDANLAPPEWLVDAVKAATAPPKREWVGLTDDEIEDAWIEASDEYDDTISINNLGRLLEAKLKEKNGYPACPPCNQDCNEGRDCPARKVKP